MDLTSSLHDQSSACVPEPARQPKIVTVLKCRGVGSTIASSPLLHFLALQAIYGPEFLPLIAVLVGFGHGTCSMWTSSERCAWHVLSSRSFLCNDVGSNGASMTVCKS